MTEGHEYVLETRLTELESALARHEAESQDLSDMITKQWNVLEKLQHETTSIKDRLAMVEIALEKASEPDPTPPHY